MAGAFHGLGMDPLQDHLKKELHGQRSFWPIV